MSARASLLLALACLTMGASAQIPRGFSNSGAPPFLYGLTHVNDGASGLAHGVGFMWDDSFQVSYPDDQGADVYSGKYESWECAGAPGAYKATFTFTYTYANGTVEGPYKACEYGVASVERGYTKWAHSTEACPDAWDQLEYTTLLDSYALEPNPCGEPAANEDPAAALDAAAGADGTVAAEEVAAARRRRR